MVVYWHVGGPVESGGVFSDTPATLVKSWYLVWRYTAAGDLAIGNSADNLRHTRSVACLVELVVLNKHQISGGGAYRNRKNKIDLFHVIWLVFL